jgi:hypothetical protein
MEQRICQLEYAAGRRKACPGDTCPFWVDDHCVVTPLWSDFGSNPELVELLGGIRADLEHRDPRRALRVFHPPGLV